MHPTTQKTSPEKNILCVLGMHRSGTSAVSGCLNILGIRLGSKLLRGRAKDNLRGFWEHSKLIEIHNDLLWELGRTWDDVRALPEAWWQTPVAIPYQKKILRVLKNDFSPSSTWGVKDPRMCLLLPLWLNLIQQLDRAPRFILMVRHPLEIAESLQKRNGFSHEKSLWLYLQHMLSAEKLTRGFSRTFVRFEDLIQDPFSTLKKTVYFDPVLLAKKKEQIRRFVSRRLRHHRADHIHPALKPYWACALALQVHGVFEDAARLGTGPEAAVLENADHQLLSYGDMRCPVLLGHIQNLQDRIGVVHKNNRLLSRQIARRTRWAKSLNEDLQKKLRYAGYLDEVIGQLDEVIGQVAGLTTALHKVHEQAVYPEASCLRKSIQRLYQELSAPMTS